MKHPYVYQHYALNSSDELVHINNTVNDGTTKYYCPFCHQEMITKRGDIRQWHFAHKSDKEECSYDKYLHTIAEKLIMEWFNKTDSIKLVMHTNNKCNKCEDCKFYDSDYCKIDDTADFDLKTYYSSCSLEKRYMVNNQVFVADILCNNKTNSSCPLFLEIYVFHECERAKIDSGIRIIEFKIQSEEDILNIINSSEIKEGENIKLYNFKRKDKHNDKLERPFQKYILFSNMKSYVDKSCYTCKNFNRLHKGIYEISFPYNDCRSLFLNCGGFYVVGKAKAYCDNFLKKDCSLCKYHSKDTEGNDLCKLYKKCGNHKYCRDNDAAICTMFRMNQDIINLAISEFNKFTSQNHVDIWPQNIYSVK